MRNPKMIFVITLIVVGLVYEWAKDAVKHSPINEIVADSGFQWSYKSHQVPSDGKTYQWKKRKIQWNKSNKKISYNAIEVAQRQAKEELELEKRNLKKESKAQQTTAKKGSEKNKAKEKSKKAKVVKKGKAKAKKDKKLEEQKDFTHNVAQNTETPESQSKETEGELTPLENPNPAVAVSPGIGVDEKNLEDKSTYEYWEIHLLANPTNKVMLDLLNNKAAQIVSDDVFYAILRDLLTDSRDISHQLAFMALRAYKTVASFNLVSEFLQSSPNSEMQKKAQAILSGYSGVDNLKVLAAVVSNSQNQYAVIKAAEFLQALANQFHVAFTPSPNMTDVEIEKQLAQREKYKKELLDLVPIIENVMKNIQNPSGQPQMISQLESTIQSIQGLTVATIQ